MSTVDSQPGTGSIVTIRGNSITQSNSPLYVIDGFPIEIHEQYYQPDEIESMEVLKDAHLPTAIYGARGANGLLLSLPLKGKIGYTCCYIQHLVWTAALY